MASDRSQSSQDLSREQSLGANGAQHKVNGDSQLSEEASEGGAYGDVASQDGDGDLFGDDGDEDAHIKPYVVEAFIVDQTNIG
jgi:hypothetical protein